MTLRLGSGAAAIAVIGRTEFHTGIGQVAAGTAEALARFFPVCFVPTNAAGRERDTVRLPSGRILPVHRDGAAVAASVLCEVPSMPAPEPPGRLRLAWLFWDSDRLPVDWVARLERFDVVLVPSAHLREVARRSGIERPIAVVPLPLPLEAALSRPVRPPGPVLRFGSVNAFHPRKGLDTLVAAFSDRFGADDRAELVVHGNLSFADTLARVRALASANVRVTHEDLSPENKDALLDGIDVFVTCSAGEGYAIGPREALARGSVLVASDIPGHADLLGPPGVFAVPASLERPAHYPELGGTFGLQRLVAPQAVGDALAAAAAFARADRAGSATARRGRAAQWSLDEVSACLAATIDWSIGAFRGLPAVEAPVRAVAVARLGPRADAVAGPRRQVCAAHDGGFFSVFNTWMSHLVWQSGEDRCHAVLPDWDIDRFLARLEAPLQSFCYGQPGDGNLWTRLFQPLFGATDAEMNDVDYLWRHAEPPPDRHNQAREPLMTYVRAYQLYGSPDFAAFRRQYHAVFRRHVRLRPEHGEAIDAFAAAHLTAPVLIAAHVRHPSHTVEQPDRRIADAARTIAAVRAAVRRRGADPDGGGWAVFVATDQERVLHQFRAAFGARAVFYPDARRTRAGEDAVFGALPPDEQGRDGHQLQHLVAADREQWSWRMAWEVVRDAYTMARCHALLHVVSNVSTAASYMNPALEMVFVEP